MSKKVVCSECIFRAFHEFSDAFANTLRSSNLLKREAEVAREYVKDDIGGKEIEKLIKLAELIEKVKEDISENVADVINPIPKNRVPK